MSIRRLKEASTEWLKPLNKAPAFLVPAPAPVLDAATERVAKLSEDFLQKEFYRAACAVLSPVSNGNYYTIQTNAGLPTPKSDDPTKTVVGNCDFFIDSELRWAFELVFDGHKISEHVNRFAPKGIYDILGCKHKAVVDFYVAGEYQPCKDSRDLHREVYWSVVYSANFSTLTVHLPPNEKDEAGMWKPRVRSYDVATLQLQ